MNEEVKYVLGENSINGTKLNDKIREEELHEYYIVEREDFIDDLIRWTAETKSSSDKALMKDDLKMLMTWDDQYILNSNSTNSYIGKNCKQFNEVCEELLEINNSIK